MKKIVILIPVYNDWQSLIKLMKELNTVIKKIDYINFHCVIINDASSIKKPEIKKPNNIKSLRIINMKKNMGHARCNAFGIKYLIENDIFDHIILMDGDGEDRPEEIELLTSKENLDLNISIVGKRIKRSEGLIFKFLYQLHKIITYIFTGKIINFGNYSCITIKDAKKLSMEKSMWSSYSGSVKKHLNKLTYTDSKRGFRYYGPSKMSLFNLIIHSFSIIAVFKNEVFIRSALMIFFVSFLTPNLGIIITIFQFILVIFCLLIFLVSLRENEDSLLNSGSNMSDIETYTH